jgi:hypothetical protein
MKPKLVKAFRRDCDFAAKHLKLQGFFRTMFVIRGHDGQVIPIMVAGGEKADAYRMVQLAAVAHDAEAVSCISEAWTLPPEATMPNLLPSESERRIEVIAVQLVTLDEALCSMREILRDAEGRITGLGPERVKPTATPAGDFSGTMSKVVPSRRPDPDAQAEARALLEQFAGRLAS